MSTHGRVCRGKNRPSIGAHVADCSRSAVYVSASTIVATADNIGSTAAIAVAWRSLSVHPAIITTRRGRGGGSVDMHAQPRNALIEFQVPARHWIRCGRKSRSGADEVIAQRPRKGTLKTEDTAYGRVRPRSSGHARTSVPAVFTVAVNTNEKTACECSSYRMRLLLAHGRHGHRPSTSVVGA